MSKLDDHRAAIVAMLAAVSEVGVVHDEEPFARANADYQALYFYTPPGGTQQIRGWFIRRTGTRELEAGRGRMVNFYSWTIRGFMSLDSAISSGKTFDAVIERIRKAYRDDMTLGGAVQPDVTDAGIQVADTGPVVFAGALCHGAELRLTTIAYLNLGE